MEFHCYAPVSFEPWDWRSPDGTGIGGSETAVVETARLLAARGHAVTVYAPLAEGCPETGPGGARWLPLAAADFSAPGVWVLHRCPSALDNFAEKKYEERGYHCDACDNGCMLWYDDAGNALPCACGRGPRQAQQTWLVCQDVFYPPQLPDGLSPGRSAKLDRCLALCDAQASFLLEKSPELKGKITRSGNGVRLDLIREVEGELYRDARCEVCGARTTEPAGDFDACECIASHPPRRDPYRLVYTSSPDRGLIPLLKIFRRAREWEPRLNLRAAYGFDNIRKCEGKHWVRVREECEALMAQPGVTWLGRLPQRQLYREFLGAGLWVYPTNFTETSCVTCMEAQALGAIPVTNPLWALADNVRHGVFLQGDPASEPLVRAAYAGEILRLTRDLDLQEKIRAEMVPWARQKFTWERVVDDWEGWAAGSPACVSWYAQYAFQLRHAKGRVLNAGCNLDFPRFGAREGGVNLDVCAADPLSGQRNPVHVLADARRPLPLGREFDTAVVGDLLEHMTDADAVRVLSNVRDVLRPGGRVVVTVPEDARPNGRAGEYAPGVSAGHPRPVTRALAARWLAAAGLREEVYTPLEYGFCAGHGFVAEVPAS